MPSKPIRFPAAQGHELAARLELPATTPRAFALFAHCFTCSKDSKAAAYISQALAARGIAVLRFDFTGLGMSGGDFADSTFSSNVGDLLAAANYLRAQHQAPQLLVGHSLGGAAVLAAAHDIAEARAVATIGTPYEPKHVAHLLKHGKDQILAAGEAETVGGDEQVGGMRRRAGFAAAGAVAIHRPQRLAGDCVADAAAQAAPARTASRIERRTIRQCRRVDAFGIGVELRQLIVDLEPRRLGGGEDVRDRPFARVALDVADRNEHAALDRRARHH